MNLFEFLEKRKYSKQNEIDNQHKNILVPSIGCKISSSTSIIHHQLFFLVGNTSSMNLIPQSTNSAYLQLAPHDPSTTFGNIITYWSNSNSKFFYADTSNVLMYNCHQTWSSNDDNLNKTTRRRNTTAVNNGPKRPVGRPPKKLQQQKIDEVVIQPSESNSLIEQTTLVRERECLLSKEIDLYSSLINK